MDLHHVHVFASDIEATIQWWSRHLGAKVFLMKSSLAPEMCFWQWGQADYIFTINPRKIEAVAQSITSGSKSPICAGCGNVCKLRA